MNTYTLTSKNISKGEAKDVFSENMKHILKMLYHFSPATPHKGDYEIYKRTIRQMNYLEGLIEKKLSRDEVDFFSRFNKTLDEAYKEYIYNYNKTKEALNDIYKILNDNKSEIMYYRICPITNEKFHILKGEDVIERIENFKTNSYSHVQGMRDSRGHFSIIDKPRYSSSDEIMIVERFHPEVVRKIKEKWNFKSNTPITADIEDGTLVEIIIEEGSVNVAYTKSVFSVQNLKLYSNTKGLHYKIRGSKRVYLDLPDIQIPV